MARTLTTLSYAEMDSRPPKVEGFGVNHSEHLTIIFYFRGFDGLELHHRAFIIYVFMMQMCFIGHT